ncbi:MAG: acyl-CoA thioesterase [Halioglobus sp.]|nr:acyl-CoA thioesterase [Halioglobus sp.]
MPERSITITPRFYETDALGHINNASIAAWFEVARITFLESLGNETASSASNWMLASLKIDFIAETFYGTDVTATVTEAVVGNSSVTVHCEMTQDGRTTVRGSSVLVHFDTSSKSPLRVPDTLRQRLADL